MREGLKTSIGSVLHGTKWQRCRVHFFRNALGACPRGPRVGAATRGGADPRCHYLVNIRDGVWDLAPAGAGVVDGFRARYPQVAAPLGSAEGDMPAHRA